MGQTMLVLNDTLEIICTAEAKKIGSSLEGLRLCRFNWSTAIHSCCGKAFKGA